MMAIHYLKTPISDLDIEKIRVGDTIYISGIIVTARDAAHKRMVEVLRKGEKLPIDLKGGVIYHAGPVVIKEGDVWKVLSAGPTTSLRMEEFEAEIIEKTGVKVIIGKGGMGRKTTEAMSKYKAIYAVFPGGAGVLAAKAIKRIVDVYWLDLGIPEALWVLEVENFGPMTVAIDCYGNNLYEKLMLEVNQRKEQLVKDLTNVINEILKH